MANRGTRRMFSRSSSWFGHLTSAVAVGTPSNSEFLGIGAVPLRGTAPLRIGLVWPISLIS